MSPHQVITVAALGGALGILGVLALALISAAAGILANKAFEQVAEWRQQQRDRRALQQAVRAAEDDRRQFDAITALPTHDPRDP
jgi:type II secretory pathway pseudopilin PulG